MHLFSPTRFLRVKQCRGWVPDLCEHGDIHPNPGPRTSSLQAKVWSCNVGRGTTSWEFFNFCKSKNIDVVCIQEVGLRQSELHALMRAAERASYRVYLADCRHKQRQSWGGVLLLVHTRLRSCQLEAYSQDDGQAVTVLIEDVALTSCYQPPHEPRMPLNSHQLEMAHLVPPSTPWVCLGDHNDEPSEHPVLQAFENDGYHAVCALGPLTRTTALCPRDGEAAGALTMPFVTPLDGSAK